jgi:hypothetical protein
MDELTIFDKIAPSLTNPLVLSGFVLLLLILLFKTLIKSEIIPPLTKTAGRDIVKKILLFGFIISLLVIVLGFAFEFYKLRQSSQAFDYTIFLENSEGKNVLKNSGRLLLRIENDKREAPIDGSGSAIFKQIPAKFAHQPVSLQIEADGWQFENGKKATEIELKGKSTTVIVTPDNSLRFLAGSVRNEQGNFLSGVRISIGNIATHTDEYGRFTLEIPTEMQKPQQTLIAYKENYMVWEADVYPATQQEVKIILKRK